MTQNNSNVPHTHEKHAVNDYKAFINFVRAFAIIWIFLYHFFHFKFLMIPFGDGFAKSVIEVFIVNSNGILDYLKGAGILMLLNGHLGAELFFVVSGFGLYISYVNSRTTWKQFYVKRAKRIIPLYWLALFAYFVSGISSISAKSLIQSMFFLQVYTSNYLAFGPMWFVGAIVFLYLLFPVLVKAFARPSSMWGLVIFSVFLSPITLWFIESINISYKGMDLMRYVPLFIAGMLLAHSVSHGTRLHRYLLLNSKASLISIIMSIILIVLSSYHLIPTVNNVICLVIFIGLGVPFLAIKKLSAERVVEFVSIGSYSMFLFHMQWIYFVATVIVRYDLVQYELTKNNEVYFTSTNEFILMGIFTLLSLLPISFFIQGAYNRVIRKAKY